MKNVIKVLFWVLDILMKIPKKIRLGIIIKIVVKSY